MEKRLYALCPRHLRGGHAGNQALHAAIDYSRIHRDCPLFIDWADNWKTSIILDGGITDIIAETIEAIKNLGVNVVSFQEPHLGNVTTASVYILDERVFLYKEYPSFRKYEEFNNIKIGADGMVIGLKSTEELQEEWYALFGGKLEAIKAMALRDLNSKFPLFQM